MVEHWCIVLYGYNFKLRRWFHNHSQEGFVCLFQIGKNIGKSSSSSQIWCLRLFFPLRFGGLSCPYLGRYWSAGQIKCDIYRVCFNWLEETLLRSNKFLIFIHHIIFSETLRQCMIMLVGDSLDSDDHLITNCTQV